MRIAIVGSGISGLVCAHRLAPRHDVSVYEAADWIGGHTHTVDVPVGGRSVAVDTGFIVFNERTYPGFCALLDELGVASRPTDMSFSVACERSGLEWASRNLRAVFAQPSNLARPSFLRMLRDVMRFNREARALLDQEDEKVALDDYLAGAGFGPELREHYVIPMGAAIWSADPETFLRFPARAFVRFFENHGLLDRGRAVPWRVIDGGSRRYVDALVSPIRDRIHLRTPVRALRRVRGGVELITGAGPERFDRVILAVHSDQALRMLLDPSGAERWVLGSIRYQPNDVVLHTDASLLPRRRGAWASWNYRVPDAPTRHALVSYHMNRLQGLDCDEELLVSLNAAERIDPARVLGSWRADHPVFDAEAMAAQRSHDAIDGVSRTHYCGAYWGWGFHEDGVQSALRVCERIEAGG